MNDIFNENIIDVRFIEASIDEGDVWAGKPIKIAMLSCSIITLILRGKEIIVPRGDVEILWETSSLFAQSLPIRACWRK